MTWTWQLEFRLDNSSRDFKCDYQNHCAPERCCDLRGAWPGWTSCWGGSRGSREPGPGPTSPAPPSTQAT